jgi:hypothetical protein
MKGNSSLEKGLLQSMMFFNQEKKWKDWANRGRGRGKEDEREWWDEGGRGRKKTKVGKKEGVKEKCKGY